MQTIWLLVVLLTLIARVASAQGDPAGPEFRVNTYTTNAQFQPALASDSFGNFIVTWASDTEDGSSRGVFGQRYMAGGGAVGPAFRVNSYTTNLQSYPAVASDASGNFVIVWDSAGQDGDFDGVFAQRYASTGAPLGPEFQVNTYTRVGQFNPAVSSDAAGNFVVVWHSLVPGSVFDFGVFGQRYANNGQPLGVEFRVNTYTTSEFFRPAVASDSSGNFVVVWSTATYLGPTFFEIRGQRFASTGVALGPEFRVNTYTTSFQYHTAIASDALGNFVVVWESFTQDGPSWGIFGQRYGSTGVPLGPEFRVNTYTTAHQYRPTVASDASGNFVVLWESNLQDGSSYGVFGQRYGSGGFPLGAEFRVNTHTTSFQGEPAVASDTAGNFIVVWQSGLQDGSSSGIFGQRFGRIVPVELMHFRVE